MTVADTGIGIAPERFTEIFELFSQGDGSAAREQGGTGLGLASPSNWLSFTAGPSVWSRSAGVGSRFTFEPATQSDDPRDADPS